MTQDKWPQLRGAVSEAVHNYFLWIYRLWERLGSNPGNLMATNARSPEKLATIEAATLLTSERVQHNRKEG